jgi:acetolactate synthase I/II/III large subunit
MIFEYDGALMSALANFIVRRLADVGTRSLFGVPGGGGNLDLIEAAGHASLPFVLTATETGGALAAMAQAEVTGQPGACLTTLGPGAASVANGVACAMLDRAPLLVFTDSHPAGADGAFEHQQFDHGAFFKPITKWSGRLSPECSMRTLEEAFAALLDVPPGPVHVDCPGDADLSSTPAVEPVKRSPAHDTSDTGGIETLLRRSRKPLIIAGLGARRPEDAAAIRALLDHHALPALVTYKAKGVIPDAHPSYAGVFTHAQMERALIEESDLIVGIGLDPVELLPRPWNYSQPVVSVCRWRVANSQIPFASQQVTDIPHALTQLDAALGDSEWNLDEVRRRVTEQQQRVDVPVAGMSAQTVVRTVARRLAAKARVTVDAGAHMLPATLLWPVAEPNQMLISNGLSTMGFALPAAIGAALLEPERHTIALTGDGGLLMCAAELLTAVREQLRIIVVVFNDASLSLIEIKQQQRRLRHSGVALGDVRWTAVAEAFGVAPFLAENESDLVHALDGAMRVDGPSLIEARIDRSNYARTLEIVRG